MSELLSPSGTKEAFKAAIANGCDAIYLGLDKYSARAYANNFSLSTLKEYIDFAHLRNVKIFVTVNTVVLDKELNDVFSTLDELAKLGVDAIIVQDLAVLNYITNHYKSLKAHASTQMGVDDLDAAIFLKDLGVERIVFARETPIEKIKEIKEKLNIEVEAFIHGALCVSYSGNCYMSSSIGERSGNRGRCAGCCRKEYSLISMDDKRVIKEGYLLSMKDLNTSSSIKDLSFVDSLKIEGRMKEPNYVASVTRIYRKILDNEKVDLDDLNKVFNRTYTKGFMNHENSSSITNIDKPNNNGYLIGKVVKQNKKTIWVKLFKSLSKGDQVVIDSEDKKEISIPVLKLFDENFKEVTTSNKIGVFTCEEKVELGSNVYKTKDAEFVESANKTLLVNEYKKLPINMEFTAKLNKPLVLKIEYKNYITYVKSEEIIAAALTKATTKENIENQLNKLNDTPYEIGNLIINLEDNLFIPLKAINELRRKGIEKLNTSRLERKVILNEETKIVPESYEEITPEITVEVNNEEQYEAAKKCGITHIYFKNSFRRNNVTYKDINGEVLVNGLGGINHYIKTNDVVSDSSLNITNHISAALLSSLGVKRITLSQEISKQDINELIERYKEEYNTNPNLELIVYGRQKIMHSKYCPLKRLGLCGKCKEGHYALKDEYAKFPIMFNDDCTTTLLNSKPLNIMDDVINLKGINYFRLSFTIESKEEVERIIKEFKKKLNKEIDNKLFDSSKHTKGHFINNPIL